MKIPSFVSVLLLCFIPGLAAEADPLVERQPLTPAQIETLVSPIALYPDPLVALILPDSTFPSDIVLAARFLQRSGSPESAAGEPWDDSVKALTRYREVIEYLDTNLAWTRRLGDCYMDQPDAVMDAIQMVRVRARAAGLLQNTAEQEIIVDSDEICIVPAQPTIIYVPRYDPVILCQPSFPTYSYYGRPFITFGIGWRIGTWLNFDCDWRGRSVRVVHRPATWYHQPNWHDRYRHPNVTSTAWTRRSPYPDRDRRHDRSPRSASYNVPGRDHRDWSERNQNEGRSRDYNRSSNDRTPGGPSANRSRSPDNRRRSETETPQRDLNPAGAAVIPPVATPLPKVQSPAPTYQRPENRRQSGSDRVYSPDNPRRDNRSQPSVRTTPPRSETAPASDMANRNRPATQPSSPPARRAESPTRSEERRRDDGRDGSSNRAGGSRNLERDNLER